MPAMPDFRLACFSCDVTVPLGVPILGSACGRATKISHPLQAHGIALLGAGDSVVIASVDYTSIGNASYEIWTQRLAEAAGTDRRRVMLSTVHNHTAPLEDLGANELLVREREVEMPIIDVAFHERAAAATGAALREAMTRAQPVTHIGLGEARVDRIASNRRIVGLDGKIKAMRHSSTKLVPELRDEPEGLIDPMLKTISFWNGRRPVAFLHCYAVHPMSYYGNGEVTYDFAGIARERRRAADPSMHQVYLTGCGGNTAPGKYNDGSDRCRAELTDRLDDAMRRAIAATSLEPLKRADFKLTPLPLTPRVDDGEFNNAAMRELMRNPANACFERVRGAFYLAYAQRHAAGHRIDLPVLDLGPAVIALLPGEPFVEFQLAAQNMRPDRCVMTVGYGDYGPIYICTDKAFPEGGYESGPWAFVGPGSEAVMMESLERALA
jgi:hypothetical protein